MEENKEVILTQEGFNNLVCYNIIRHEILGII